jgi:hypothetical protein
VICFFDVGVSRGALMHDASCSEGRIEAATPCGKDTVTTRKSTDEDQRIANARGSGGAAARGPSALPWNNVPGRPMKLCRKIPTGAGGVREIGGAPVDAAGSIPVAGKSRGRNRRSGTEDALDRGWQRLRRSGERLIGIAGMFRLPWSVVVWPGPDWAIRPRIVTPRFSSARHCHAQACSIPA